MSKVKVLKTATRFPMSAHRSDFETCPHCERRFEYRKWNERTVAVAICPVGGHVMKHATLGECPHCEKESWVHHDVSFFRVQRFDGGDDWKAAVSAIEELESQRNIQAAREWATGLCGRCRHLESATLNQHARRSCIKGSGSVETECDRFWASELEGQRDG